VRLGKSSEICVHTGPFARLRCSYPALSAGARGTRVLRASDKMDGMSSALKWWSRLSAAAVGAVLTLVVPVHAWAASNGVADVAVEAARYRRRGGVGFFGFLSLCCLVVVGGIVLAVVLISRNRKRR
jgi:hypothetical protein